MPTRFTRVNDFTARLDLLAAMHPGTGNHSDLPGPEQSSMDCHFTAAFMSDACGDGHSPRRVADAAASHAGKSFSPSRASNDGGNPHRERRRLGTQLRFARGTNRAEPVAWGS